jgi:hypothetical protein
MSFGHFLHHVVQTAHHQPWFAFSNPVDTAQYDRHRRKQGQGSVSGYNAWSNHDTHAAASDARIAATNTNRGIKSNINDLHVMFGDYAGPDAGMQADSAANAAGRQGNYDHYRRAYLDYFSPQLNDQYNTANHNDLFSGVRTGTEGGSADALRQGSTLNKYVQAQQQLGSKANSAVNDLQAGDNAREMDLANQIQHGGDAAYLVNSGLRGSLQSLGAAQDAIGGTALGDVFNNAGSLYEQGQIAQGNGRRGLSLTDPSTSGSGLLTGT